MGNFSSYLAADLAILLKKEMAFNSHWISLGGLNKIYLTLMDLNVQYILAAVVVQKFYLMANGVGRLLTNLLLLKLLDLLALFCLEQGCCF